MRFFRNDDEVKEVLEQKEVIDFVAKFERVKQGDKEEFKAPSSFTKLCLERIGRYSKLYPLLEEVFAIDSPGRITITSDISAAEFKRPGEPIPAEDFGVDILFEFGNGFRVSKVIFIPKDIIEDEVIEVEKYVMESIGKAIALALDNAILNGQGKGEYEIEGIIKSIPAENKIAVTPTKLIDILKPIKLLDSGEYNDNEIVAVVNRDTYYSILLEHLIDCNNPKALPEFVICHGMGANQVLYADFSKYILIQRGRFSIESSEHVRFLTEETGYKGNINFDGKPVRPQAFVLVTLE